MKKVAIMALSLFALFSCGRAVENLDVEKFAERLAEGVRVLDVRTPEEFAEGCIPGAVNIDWNAGDLVQKADAMFDSTEPIYLYCRSGRRSAAAAKALAKAGYKAVNLLGGYEAWTAAGKRIDQDFKYAANLIAPGNPVPDFTLNDLEGNPVKISELQGKRVVLVFWASWCPDCRAEVPELKAMHAAADPGAVQFVSVSFDREFETLCNYVRENDLPGIQLFDPAGKKESKVAEAFGVKWIPSLYLIDAEGKVELSTVMAWKIADALEGKLRQPQKPRGALCSDESCAI